MFRDAVIPILATIATRADGIGGLSYLEDTGDVEIGYGIVKPYWGKGLASEAAAATLNYGFEQVGLDRIAAITWPENLASQRVLAKLGMRYVKTGQFDHVEMRYFAISREEFAALAKSVRR